MIQPDMENSLPHFLILVIMKNKFALAFFLRLLLFHYLPLTIFFGPWNIISYHITLEGLYKSTGILYRTNMILCCSQSLNIKFVNPMDQKTYQTDQFPNCNTKQIIYAIQCPCRVMTGSLEV